MIVIENCVVTAVLAISLMTLGGMACGYECGEGTMAIDGVCEIDQTDDDQNPYTFTIATRAVSETYHFISLTDATGNVACGLATGPQAELGMPGRQLLISLIGYPTSCAPGTTSIKNDCTTESLGSACAWYREWGQEGTLITTEVATAGTVVTTLEGTRCAFAVDLVFPSAQQVSDLFDVEGDSTELKCTGP